MQFANRNQAGQELAAVLEKYRGQDLIIMGIPRGGLVVAAVIAEILDAPMDIIVPRKIGSPFNPEVAIGAVTQDGTLLKDERVIDLLGLSEEKIKKAADTVRREISRREAIYRNNRPAPDLRGKIVIIVDDGIATGFTVKAALKSVRKYCPKKLVLAVPVAPPETVEELQDSVDDLVCLYSPTEFRSVGEFYQDFNQTTDKEVIDLLKNRPLLTAK